MKVNARLERFKPRLSSNFPLRPGEGRMSLPERR